MGISQEADALIRKRQNDIEADGNGREMTSDNKGLVKETITIECCRTRLKWQHSIADNCPTFCLNETKCRPIAQDNKHVANQQLKIGLGHIRS